MTDTAQHKDKDTDAEGRPLTAHERAMIEPVIEQIQHTRRTLAQQEAQLYGLLALAEPAMLDEASGMTFDPNALRFKRRAGGE